MLKDLLSDYDPECGSIPLKPIQPVKLMILDINMPHMDGLQTVKETRALYKEINERVCLANGLDPIYDQILYRPMLIYMSKHEENIQLFMEDQERADLFVNKPIERDDILSILRILKIV